MVIIPHVILLQLYILIFLFMKIKNKNFLAIALLFWVIGFSYVNAEDSTKPNNPPPMWGSDMKWEQRPPQMWTWDGQWQQRPPQMWTWENRPLPPPAWWSWSFMPPPQDWSGSFMPPPRIENKKENSNQFLKWKIDWYKVILNWQKYSWTEEILWYKIIFTSPSWEEKTLSVEASKTSLENWDAKSWVNKYKLVVVWTSWDLFTSNEVVLSMWPNWGYDFSNTKMIPPTPENKQKPQMWEKKEEFKERKEEFKEQKDQIKENKQEIKSNLWEFRQENWFLEQYLTWYSEESKKQILDLKKQYQDKVFELIKSSSWNLTEDQKAQIEALNTEFMSKIKELVWDNEKLLEFLKLRTEVFNQNQQLRDKNQEIRDQFKQNMSQNKDSMKDQKWINWWLKDKYKKLFEKKLESKLSSLSQDKIKSIISKIDSVISTYNESWETLSQDVTKKIAQLEALKDILNDKLTESDDFSDIENLLEE